MDYKKYNAKHCRRMSEEGLEAVLSVFNERMFQQQYEQSQSWEAERSDCHRAIKTVSSTLSLKRALEMAA